MSEDVALPKLELPKRPYRSRFYRDNAFGRLTGKPMNVTSQKNADTSTIVNNLFAGLESINDTQSPLDSTSQFEVQFSKGKKPMNEFSKDLQFEKKWSSARTQLQQHENNQSYHVPESYADKKGGNNGSFSSKKQTAHCSGAVAIAADKANVDNGGVGNGVCTHEAVGGGRGFDKLKGSLLADVEAQVVEADMSPVDKFGIAYDAETSVVNSTPYPSKPSENCQPNVRLCFNTSVTPIAVKSPNVRAERKNIVSNALGVERPKTLSTCFGEKPTVSELTQPPQVEPRVFAPKCNDFEFELMEEESFSFESWATIPRKELRQRPVEQENKSGLIIKNAKEQEKRKKAVRNQVAVTDEKQKELLNEHLTLCTELEDRKSCKQNKQLQPEESAKSSFACPKKKNVEELQNKPSTASKLSLTSTQNTKLGYEKRDQYTKCMNLVSVPLAETTADNNENDKLAGLETHQPRTNLFSGNKKESTIVNSSPVLSRLPQTIKSKRPSLCASETPALMNNLCVDNQQNTYPSENVVPSTSGLEKQQKKSSFLSFGIKPAFSALPHVKKIHSVTSAPNLGFEFDLDEENFCFESLITIPKKAFIQKQHPAEQEKKPVTDTKKTIKNNRTQKVAKARKLTIQSKKVDDEKHVVHNKDKNENQSRKRPAHLLKNNIEKEEEEHNEPSTHSKCFLPPRQKKKKSARSKKKSVVESEGNGEQEKLQEPEELHQERHLHIKEYNYTEKAETFDQNVITSKKFSESESSRNLSPTDSKYLVASKQTKLGGKKQGRQRKTLAVKSNRAKEQEEIKASFHGQEIENRMEGCRMSELSIMTPKNLPANESSVNDCNEKESKQPLFANSVSENKKRTKKQQKQMAIVRKISKKESQLIKQSSSKKNLPFNHEPDENLVQDDTFKICSKRGRCIRAPPKWWVVQHADDKLQRELKTNYSPEQKAKLQERMAKGKSAKSRMKKKMVLKEASSAQTEPLETERCSSEEPIGEKVVFKNIFYPDSPPQDSFTGSPSIKKQSRKKKCTAASIKPKQRLFSEAEEKAKPSDMHQRRKQKYHPKQKVHNISISDKSEMQQNVYSDELTSSAYVSAISLSSTRTSHKPFQGSSACLSTTYVVKSPQKPAHGHPEIIKVSSATPNPVVTSPRNSVTTHADQPCTREQFPSAIPYHVAVRTRRYQDKAVPSQPCGQTQDENNEGNESECSTSVRGMRTLKQGCLDRDLPVFNKSGPGPSVNIQESSGEGEDRNLEHEAYDHEKPPKGEHLMSTRVWGEKENNEIFVDCVKTSEMCKFFYPLRTKYDDNRSIAICKSLNFKTFSSGKLVLGPYKEKGCQMVYKDTMIFHILKGDLGITIYHTTYHLKEGDNFFVPSGNTYNVTNLQDTEAVLLFTQLKGAKME